LSLSQKAIDELKVIHKNVTGDDLSDRDALEMGMNLLNLFSAIYRPIPKRFLSQDEDKQANPPI
jgi:hypothetical protein